MSKVVDTISSVKEPSTITREQPHNLEAEQALLGALLANNEHLHKISDFLLEEHFFQPVHGRIYQAICQSNEKGLIATPISLKNLFEADAALEAVGGGAYLAQLSSLAMTVININDYAHIIFDNAIRRKLINIGEEMINGAHNPSLDEDAKLQIEQAEQHLFHLASLGADDKGFQSLKISLTDAIARAERSYKNKNKVSGISSGFLDLDNMLGGFQDSDLLILAGRPSMGKTALAVNLAVNAAQFIIKQSKDDTPPPAIGFFSLEMSSEQLASRMLAMETGVNASMLRNGSISSDDFAKIVQGSKALHQLPFYIDDTPALSIAALRARARRLKRKHNMAILVVDYLQLIRGVSKGGETNRVQEVSEITQGLKAIAKELNIPVIALSQLSRAVEQREDKRPQLSDLRDSGSIEQDADIVMFIYREEYYLSRRMPSEDSDKFVAWQEEMNRVMNLTEVIIAKHRNGPIGTATLFFDSNLTKFVNYTSDKFKD